MPFEKIPSKKIKMLAEGLVFFHDFLVISRMFGSQHANTEVRLYF